MAKVRRPASLSVLVDTCTPQAFKCALDPAPSLIIPHLFIGNLQQTNRETLDRLNISYILSLGQLPIVSNIDTITNSPTASNKQTLLPTQNSSKDFKIRIKSNEMEQNFSLNQSQNNDRDENQQFDTVKTIQCKCINVSDDSDQALIKFFDEAFQFIEEARRKKCNILVHCLAGISRSPAIAIAYLMRLNSLKLQEAYKIVKESRPQIDPNLSFIGQLMIYDTVLKESSSLNDRNKLNSAFNER